MAKVQHTVTGCVPIDRSIVEAYVKFAETEANVNANEEARQEAEAGRVLAESARVAAEQERELIAGSDHTRAGEDHSVAVEDHAQAGLDHVTAGSDHTRAVEDHSVAVEDHTIAVADAARAEAAAAAAEHMVDIKTGPQGPQGNTGSSVDYPYELVNNITTDDATKGLSAAQGVVLDGKIGQLGQPQKIIYTQRDAIETLDGYIAPDGSIVFGNTWTKVFDVEGVSHAIVTGRQGNDVTQFALAGAYDKNNNLLQIYFGTPSTSYNENFGIELPASTKYVKVCTSNKTIQPNVALSVNKIIDGLARVDATPLSANTDLNSLTYGVYSFLSSVVPTLVNCPVTTGGGMLIVERPTPASGNYRRQTIIMGASGDSYYRSERGLNVWNDWKQFAYMNAVADATGKISPISIENGYLQHNGTVLPESSARTYKFDISNLSKVYITGRQGGDIAGYAIAAFYNSSDAFISGTLVVLRASTNYYDYPVGVPTGAKYVRVCTSNISIFNQVECKTFSNTPEIVNYNYNRNLATPLSSGTDLNTLTYGVYSFLADVTPTLVNCPLSSGGGMLIVERSSPSANGNFRKQTIINGIGEAYTRSERGVNVWNDWGEVAPLNKAYLEGANNESNLLPSYWVGEINNRIDAVLSNRLTIGNNIVEFIFITDTHFDTNAKNSPMLIRYLQKALSIPHVVFGGDAIAAAGATKLAGLQELQKFVCCFDDVFFTVGNHDYNDAYTDSVKLTDAQLYPAIGKQTEQYAVTNKTIKVSYFDNVNQKVRFVQYAYTLTNVQDVLDCISGLDSDWTVVFFTHMYWEPHTDGVPTVISARRDFMNSIIGGSYQCTIAAFIVGHVHKDVSDLLDNNIPVIGTTTDSFAPWINNYGGPSMSRYTDTEQAFDIIQIDTSNRKLYYTRVGAGDDRQFNY